MRIKRKMRERSERNEGEREVDGKEEDRVTNYVGEFCFPLVYLVKLKLMPRVILVKDM